MIKSSTRCQMDEVALLHRISLKRPKNQFLGREDIMSTSIEADENGVTVVVM